LFFYSSDFLGQIDRRRLLELASTVAQLEHAGPMQSAVSIDRFRPPIVIRAFNRFGAMLNGKVSRRIPPEELIETAKRRANLDDFGDGDFREPLGRLLAATRSGRAPSNRTTPNPRSPFCGGIAADWHNLFAHLAFR